MKRIVAALALVGLLVVAAPASAAQKTYYYDGKTVAGNSLSLSLKGNRVFDIDGYVNSTCVPTHGTPLTLMTDFKPPGGFVLGHARKVSQTEYISYKGDVTKNYEITVKKKGRIWTVGLHVNYSYEEVIPGAEGQLDKSFYICQGDDAFKLLV